MNSSSAAVANKDSIAFPLGRIASGLYVVTAGGGANKTGMLASWVMQAGFEPPAIAMAISPEREMYRLIQETQRFSINILGKDNTGMMKTFGKYTPDQFTDLPHTETQYGVNLTDTIGVLHVTLQNIIPVGDHHLVTGLVEDGETFHAESESFVHLRKSGFNY
ncbi:MAG: flavin reductase family protein [Candidatus Melainabacteria bacterium]